MEGRLRWQPKNANWFLPLRRWRFRRRSCWAVPTPGSLSARQRLTKRLWKSTPAGGFTTTSTVPTRTYMWKILAIPPYSQGFVWTSIWRSAREPGMQLLGLPRQVAFLWVVGNTLGLAYGSAVLMDYARQGKLTGTEADLLNYHLAISHSQLEDPLLFAVLGLPVVWLIVPRILLAFIVVWLKRLADFIFPAQAMALSQKI